MNEKKDPSQDCHLERGEGATNNREELIKDGYNLQVSISRRGYVLHGFDTKSKGKPENLKKREKGDIEGWSTASRRRLRRFIHDYTSPAGWLNFGVTLTVPGPVLSPLEYKALWSGFTSHMSRKPVLVIWRAEVQQRGALHWHLIVSLPPSESVYRVIGERWFTAIEGLGEVHNYTMKNGTVVSYASSRMALSGALERCVNIQPEQENDSWWRYLCDHASKSKQEQIGKDIGRHWGIVGRGFAVPSISLEVCELTYKENFTLRRCLRRLCTPRLPDPSDPFGFSLGYAPKTSVYGRQDRFGHVKAVSRLISWVKACTASNPPF